MMKPQRTGRGVLWLRPRQSLNVHRSAVKTNFSPLISWLLSQRGAASGDPEGEALHRAR